MGGTGGGASAPDSARGATADSARLDTSIVRGDTGTAPSLYVPGDPDVVVDCNGNGDFTTIAAAVSAVPSGTRVGLLPCTYRESVDYRGKSLDIFGLGEPALTVIQGDGATSVVTARRGEGPGTRLAGVTVTGGGGGRGSALDLLGAVIEFEHVALVGNHGADEVVWAEGVALALTDVTVEGNTVAEGGAVLSLDNGSLVAERLHLDCGDAPLGVDNHLSLLLRESTIECPGAGVGLSVDGGELHLRQSRVDGGVVGILAADKQDNPNERLWLYNAVVTGSEVALAASWMRLEVDHAVLWGETRGLALANLHPESWVHNSAVLGGSCPLSVVDADVDVAWVAFGSGSSCDVVSVGDITGDPLFANAPGDFHLHAHSPLVDAGDPAAEDVDGSRADVGAYGGERGGW